MIILYYQLSAFSLVHTNKVTLDSIATGLLRIQFGRAQYFQECNQEKTVLRALALFADPARVGGGSGPQGAHYDTTIAILSQAQGRQGTERRDTSEPVNFSKYNTRLILKFQFFRKLVTATKHIHGHGQVYKSTPDFERWCISDGLVGWKVMGL